MAIVTAPGPRGTKAFLVGAGMFIDPLRGYRRIAAHGDISSLRLTRDRWFFMVSRPEYVEHILVKNQDNYVKSFTYRPLRMVLGDGLVTAEGLTWRRHRRIIQPVFSRRQILGFAPQVIAAADRALAKWDRLPSGGMVLAGREMSALTLDVVAHALFGADLSAEALRMNEAITFAQDGMMITSLVPFLFTDPSIARIKKATRGLWGRLDAIDGPVRRAIAAHRAAPSGPPEDLVGLMLAARDSDGSALSDTEIRDELTTFLLAGHETTAVALSWSLALLSASPAVRDRLEEEVDSVPPDTDDIDKLPWTQAVVSETMRLYPPAWTVERDALEDDEVGGVRIPAGSTVAVPPYIVHRHQPTWPNPEGFDPRRFLPGAGEDRHRYAYIPFGGGRRACIGMGFAQLEAVLLLAAIARRYRFDLLGTIPAPIPRVTLRPGNALPMRLTRRP